MMTFRDNLAVLSYRVLLDCLILEDDIDRLPRNVGTKLCSVESLKNVDPTPTLHHCCVRLQFSLVSVSSNLYET
jgi:hypothetical protein